MEIDTPLVAKQGAQLPLGWWPKATNAGRIPVLMRHFREKMILSNWWEVLPAEMAVLGARHERRGRTQI